VADSSAEHALSEFAVWLDEQSEHIGNYAYATRASDTSRLGSAFAAMAYGAAASKARKLHEHYRKRRLPGEHADLCNPE